MNYRIYLNLSGKQPAYTDNTIFVGIDGTVNAHVQGRIVPCTVPSLSENDIKTLIAQQVTGEIDAADVTKIVNAAIEAAGEGVATQDWVIQQIGTLAFEEKDTLAITALNEHIAGDETRWNVTQDLIASTQSKILKTVQEMILGVSLPLDYNQPVTVVGTNGLLSLATNNEWTVPYNGAIQCSAGGALTTAISVMVIRGSSVVSTWTSPTYVLGLPLGGDPSPSDYIAVQAGDVVTTSGLLAVGSPLNVTYWQNKI